MDNKRNNIFSEHGKIPPQSVDLENAVLGATLLEKTALSITMDLLFPEAFYKQAHSIIFDAAQQLFKKNNPVDILTVSDKLKSMGQLENVGGAYYITQLTNGIGSTTSVEYHSRIVLQKFYAREIIRISSEHLQAAFEETTDVFDLQDTVNKDVLALSRYNDKKPVSSISDLVKEVEERTEDLRTGKIEYAGIYVKLGRFDEILKGFSAPDIIIIAARPGMGKTAFMVTLIRKIAMQNIHVAVFSLEMSKIQITIRLIAQESGMTFNQIKMGHVDPEEMKKHSKTIEDLPIHIDDTGGLTLIELKSKLFQLKMEYDIQICFIDYIQLMGGIGNNRNDVIGEISRGVKATAKDLDICIVPLSQLSRAVENRGGTKRPQLSDLRESGGLEADADSVMFLFRPEYYKMDTDEWGAPIPAGKLEIDVAKNRNGALGTIDLSFIPKSMNIISNENYIDSLSESDSEFNFNTQPKEDKPF